MVSAVMRLIWGMIKRNLSPGCRAGKGQSRHTPWDAACPGESVLPGSAMRPPRILQRPVLISISAKRWRRDVLALRAWPSARLVLNPARDREDGILFFAAAANPQLWSKVRRAAIG